MARFTYAVAGINDVELNERYYFGQLWSGFGNAQKALDSGTAFLDDGNVINFEIVENNENILKTLVCVTDY